MFRSLNELYVNLKVGQRQMVVPGTYLNHTQCKRVSVKTIEQGKVYHMLDIQKKNKY